MVVAIIYIIFVRGDDGLWWEGWLGFLKFVSSAQGSLGLELPKFVPAYLNYVLNTSTTECGNPKKFCEIGLPGLGRKGGRRPRASYNISPNLVQLFGLISKNEVGVRKIVHIR